MEVLGLTLSGTMWRPWVEGQHGGLVVNSLARLNDGLAFDPWRDSMGMEAMWLPLEGQYGDLEIDTLVGKYRGLLVRPLGQYEGFVVNPFMGQIEALYFNPLGQVGGLMVDLFVGQQVGLVVNSLVAQYENLAVDPLGVADGKLPV